MFLFSLLEQLVLVFFHLSISFSLVVFCFHFLNSWFSFFHLSISWLSSANLENPARILSCLLKHTQISFKLFDIVQTLFRDAFRNKLQKLEGALIEQMLTTADLADRGDRGDQGDHGDWGDRRNGQIC